MSVLEPNWLLPVLAVVQVAGLAAAWLARASQGSEGHAVCQWLFLITLAAVAFSAIFSMAFPSGIWLLSGITMSVMIVGTTCDFRRVEQVSS